MKTNGQTKTGERQFEDSKFAPGTNSMQKNFQADDYFQNFIYLL